MELLDGKYASSQLKAELKERSAEIKQKLGRSPRSAIVLVGNNPASEVYVKNKIKSSEAIDIETELIKLDQNIPQEDLLRVINTLNTDNNIDGFIVQLPLPSHIAEYKIIEAISPEKDIDGFHPQNIGKITLNLPGGFIPATPSGILELIKFYGVETAGKHCVIVGRSNIVGRPLSILLSQKGFDATVSLCHSQTPDLKFFTKEADILIAAIGKPNFITSDMIRDGAIVIDVGINRIKSDKTKSGWKLTGDVDFEKVKEKASYITPVPGGVGPMTIAALLKNIIIAAERKIKN